jgi:hypothetical protein
MIMDKQKSITLKLNETTNPTIEYKLSTLSGKFYITTDLDLNGRGITMCGDGKDHKRGKKTYQVTKKAFDKLKAKYDTCYINN